MEHNLRFLEAVARFPGRKYLLACLVVGDIEATKRRLESQGISCTTGRVPLLELWRICSESRINIIRLGVEDCIPWRMTDLLAMGACPVLDQRPFTIWPQPLQEGDSHYLSLEAHTPVDRATADDSAYQSIPSRLDSILASDVPEEVENIYK